MPATATSGRKKSRASAPRKKKKSSNPLLAWWPLLLGIAVTPFTVHAASIVALAGPGALMALYPYVLLLKHPALGLSTQLANNLSQWMMYLQFPLYGLLMSLILRSKNLLTALGAGVAVHLVAVLIVVTISH
jgi:hypothetical protein